MVKISIIIPTYNVEKYIKECLNSIIKQTIKLEDLEVIIIDDCSKDSSYEIASEYAKKYSNFKVIKLPKRSGYAGRPRNEGIKHASGKYIMFTDADDFYTEDACEIMYNAIEKYSADFITANYINTDENAIRWKHPIFDTKQYSNFKLNINDYRNSFFVMCSSVCVKIFNRKFILKNNIKFLEGVPAEDAYFSMSSFLVSKNAYYIKDVIYNYRQRSNIDLSSSYNCSLSYFRAINQSYKELYNKFKEYNEIGYYRYFYAKSMSYMISKFIDSNLLTKDERIEYFNEMKWFYNLSKELEVCTSHEKFTSIVNKICDNQYEEALIEAIKVKNERKLMVKEIKDRMSKPTKELYDNISKLDYKYKKEEYSCTN